MLILCPHFVLVSMQLKEDGILIPGPNNLSTQKRVRGGRVRFWQLTAESFVETLEPPETGLSKPQKM